MKLEAGKRYNRRDGQVSGVVVIRDSSRFPFYADGQAYDGLGLVSGMGSPNMLDLISEHFDTVSEPTDEYGPWIGWNGGECPVDVGDTVQPHFHWQTRQQAEKNRMLEMTMLPMNWEHQDASTDIIAYRVKKEPPAPISVSVWISPSGVVYNFCASTYRKAIITTKGDNISIEWSEE